MSAKLSMTNLGRITAIWMLVVLTGILVVAGCQTEPDDGLTSTERKRMQLSGKFLMFIQGTQMTLEEGDPLRALVMADSAVNALPDLADSHFLRARALTMLKRYDEAKESYKKALELDPDYLIARFNLGNMSFHLEEYEAALDYYMDALKIRKLDDVADGEVEVNLENQAVSTGLLQIGRVYDKLSKPDLANDAFEYALFFDSTNSEAYHTLAFFLSDLGKNEEALEASKKAVELDSTNIDYNYKLANLMVSLGSYELAIPILNSILERRPWQLGAHYTMGQALVNLGQVELADSFFVLADSVQKRQTSIDQFNEGVRLNPRSPYFWNGLGMAYLSAGRYEDAIETYRFLIMLNENNPSAWYNLAIAYDEVGEGTLARYSLRRALDFRPDFAEADALLKELLAQ